VAGELLPIALVHIRPDTHHIAFRLREGTILVGRGEGCELILTSDTVSRRHAELIVSSEQIQVRDLSRNGTFINDQRVENGVARIGDRLKFGGVPFLLNRVEGLLEEDEETIATGEEAPKLVTHPRYVLTNAQRRVYALLLRGHSEKEVANALHLSTNTVHSHVQAIYAAFGVNSRAKLISKALSDP